MQTKIVFAALVLLSILNSPLSTAHAQGTAFTYQGRLNVGSSPANGSYDLRFLLYDNSIGGNQQGPILTNSAIAVSNGLFIVTLDFGNVFPGAARWLDIAVRTNGNSAFTELSTRQPLTPAPYAITAGNVISGGLAAGTYGNAISFTNNSNSFTGNGAGLNNVNAVSFGGLSAANYWQLGGNTPGFNQFLGSVNNQPMTIRANNLQVMQFAYASNSASGYSPNIIGGNGGNSVSAGVVGATIAGGGAPSSFLSGPNSVTADFGTVIGGLSCTAGGRGAIAGGGPATASGQYSVAFGSFVSASGDYSVAMGNSTASGTNSTAFGFSRATNSYAFAAGYQTVAGGLGSTAVGYLSQATNTISTALGGSYALGYASTAVGNSDATGDYSTAMGNSIATGDYSTALGGSLYGGGTEADGASSFAAGAASLAANDYSFVWSDGSLPIYTSFTSTGDDQFLIHANGGVGIGTNAPAAALHVASQTTGTPQVQITQQNASDSVRLRMNSGDNLAWEMDVTAGSSPQYQIWYVGAAGPRMIIDTGGNVYATSFNPSSDRNLKENFQPVNVQDVLEKVAALPITRWDFKADTNTPHLGPMAQDFHAAFHVGTDDKHIATVDEDGVALAAIQGLNQKLNEKDVEIAALKTRLEKLEQLLASTKGNDK